MANLTVAIASQLVRLQVDVAVLMQRRPAT